MEVFEEGVGGGADGGEEGVLSGWGGDGERGGGGGDCPGFLVGRVGFGGVGGRW